MTTYAPAPGAARSLSAVLLVSALAACGGGGDSPAPAPAPAPAAVPITSANSDTAAARGYDVANALFDASNAASGTLKSAPAGTRTGLVRFALAQVESLGAGQGAVGPSTEDASRAAKGTTTDSAACASGGSVTVTTTDLNDNGAPDAGDTASIAFAACAADGVVASGSMTIAFNSYTSGATADRTSVTVTFKDLRIADGSDVSSASGDMTLAATIGKVAPLTTEVTLSGTKLVLVDGSESRTLVGYSGQLKIDDTRRTYSYSVAGAVSGTGVPGTVTLSTPVAITGSLAGKPSAGQLVVVGSSNSTVTLTAIPASGSTVAGVSVALDANGDGTAEATRTLTWAQFEAL